MYYSFCLKKTTLTWMGYFLGHESGHSVQKKANLGMDGAMSRFLSYKVSYSF